MTYVPKILSGIDIIDKSWGGMYQGGSYLCYGHASNGRGLAGMLFLQMGVLLEEKGLFLSPGRPQDWMIQAASIDFDLEEAQKNGLVRLVWIPTGVNPEDVSDVRASRAIEDLVALIKAEERERVLINDFMPFLQFRSFDRFRQMFGWMMGQLSGVSSTVLIMMPDIVNVQSRQILEFMKNQMAGSMHISMPEAGGGQTRRLVLWPGLGHVRHEIVDPWEIYVAGEAGKSHAPAKGNKTAGRKSTEGKGAASFSDTVHAMPEDVSSLGGSLSSLAVDTLRDVEVVHGAFYNKLKKSFKQRATKKYKPFLLVALRMESDYSEGVASIGLDMLLPAIEKIVLEPDDILVDLGRQRMIAFLPNQKEDDVQEFFESIQHQLREEYPTFAEQLPHVVSAVVVPNGEPFETPEDFLAYALEGN